MSLALNILAIWSVLSLLAIPLAMLLGRTGRQADEAATGHHAELVHPPGEDPSQLLLPPRELAGSIRSRPR